MHWEDHGIVLATRAFGEGKAIVTLLTEEHGKASGLCRGTGRPGVRGLLQTGNLLSCKWQGRLAEHLGAFQIDLQRPYAASTFNRPLSLEMLCSASELCLNSLAEHDPHQLLFQQLCALLDALSDNNAPISSYLRFELQLLEAAGFYLDFSHCAATGSTENLCYISPKTGRAVSKAAGEPYHHKLFPLHDLLRAPDENAPASSFKTAFEITGFFLHHHVLHHQQKRLPTSRERMLKILVNAEAAA